MTVARSVVWFINLLLFPSVVCSMLSGPVVAGEPVERSGRIAFVANAEGNWDLFALDEKAGNVVEATSTVYDEVEPCWSRDRRRSVYSTSDGRLEIMDFRTKERCAVSIGGKRGRNTSASFSPDSRELVYVHLKPEEADDSELAVFDLEANTHTPFLDQFGPQLFPDWSPDGKQIVYTSAHCGMECGRVIQELWIAEVNGRSARQLLMTNSHCTHPIWSRDGKRIAFSSDMNGNFDIWVVTVEDGHLEQITSDPHLDTSPAWSPDGRKMAFISGRTGRLKIWIKDLTTGQLKMLSPFGDKDVECRDVAW